MALKSAAERFRSIMNDEDFDSEGPSIEVEINVVQKEIEAEEEAHEVSDAISDVEDTNDTIEQAETTIEQSEMIVKVLREDGINPVALKILSTNKNYIDLWNIGLPSVETLDVVGNNRRQAEALADNIEAKTEALKATVQRWWKKFVEFLKRLFGVGEAKLDASRKRLEKLLKEANKLSKDDINMERLEKKEVENIKKGINGERIEALGKQLSQILEPKKVDTGDTEKLADFASEMKSRLSKGEGSDKLRGAALYKEYENIKNNSSSYLSTVKGSQDTLKKLQSQAEKMENKEKNDENKQDLQKYRSAVSSAASAYVSSAVRYINWSCNVLSAVIGCAKIKAGKKKDESDS